MVGVSPWKRKKSLNPLRWGQQRPESSVECPINILLTNGRFPVSLDLARQFALAGCRVYCVDPMRFHICRFSKNVVASKVVSAPRTNSQGYVNGVKEAIRQWDIRHVIPVHEEEFCLAESKDAEILDKLYAPLWDILLRLHSKWDYVKMMQRFGLDVPEAHLCRSMDDVRKLDPEKEWAVKPVFGRANTNVYHLRPGQGVPLIHIGDEAPYVAQEWIYGERYCSYSVFDHGVLRAHGTYPVLETIDGSSCVYFQACEHARIKEYVERLASHLYPLHGQIGLDFVDTGSRLVTVDCNPRATSGIHLWSGAPCLARAFIDQLEETFTHPPFASGNRGVKREVLSGMLMWEHKNVTLQRYLKHLWRLVSTRDIVWKWSDLMPSLASPFLLMYYYALCKRHNLTLPDLFQWDLIWEPTAASLEPIRTSAEIEMVNSDKSR